ncbi:MAG: TonB-dependent receptor [Saprospiraceae bacterium]|nr:TonB-dependent receptor [Pyrinomonadaceae bacterium]
MKNLFGRLVLAGFSMFVLCFAAAAQDLDDITFSGRIADANGLAVVGASVTATEVQSGVERTVMTGDEGRYRIIELKPGIYKLKVSASGFGAQEKIDIQTVSGQNVQSDFQLVPAGVTAQQTVTVTEDDTPLVDTTRTIVGGTITAREIEEIPNNSRNALDLVLTLGGTSEEALSTRDLAEDRNAANRQPPTEQGNFSLSGGASYSNNITIDGLDNNDDRAASDRFQPSLESIAEVQVITNQFSAEYGRASGGRINLRTKSGSNKFRGRVFMFFRADDLNANTYYNNSTFYKTDNVYRYNGGTGTATNTTLLGTTLTVLRDPLERLPFTEYNPGFTFSGPVILPFGEGKSIYDGTNRTFFSIAYENLNLLDTTLINTYVPAGTNLRFNLPVSTGGPQVCENFLSTSNSNCSNGGAAFMLPYSKLVSTPNQRNALTARIDHKLFENNDVTLGWQLGRKRNQRQNIESTTKLEEALQGTSGNTDAINFTDNHVFGAKVVNQFRFQWSTYKPSFETKNPDDPVVLITYADPTTSTFTGRTLIAGNSSASLTASGIFAAKRKENRYQFQDSLTVVAGKHTFKGGFDFQRINSQNLDPTDATGTYNFGNSGTGVTTANFTGPCTPAPCAPATVSYLGVQNYLLNQSTRFRQNFGTSSDIINTYWGIFLNDEMRLAQNLTLSIGARYERETILSDNNNVGPRIGIAWDPFKKGKGVIRFGAGIFYNRVLLRTIDDFLVSGQQDLFDSADISGTATRLAVMRAFSAQFPRKFASAQELRNFINPVLVANGGIAGDGFSGFDGFLTRLVDTSTLKIPESYQFNIGFEREIGKGFVFEANYTWNKTVRLWGESNPNSPNLGLANSRLGTNFQSWTEYLQSISTGNFRYVLGPTNDNVGISTGTCSAASPCTVNLNTTNPSTAASAPIGLALEAVKIFKPGYNVDPNLSNENQQELLGSVRKSSYQGLILELRSRQKTFGLGFRGNFRAVYTLASLKDDGLNNTSDAEVNGDFNREWSRALQDRRHRFAFSATFETPSWLGKLKLSPLFRYGSSAPFNLSYSGIDRNLDDLSNDRVNFSGDTKDIKWRKPGSPVPAELLSQFSLQPIGANGGNLPRNAGNGPPLYIFDLNMTREFKFGERMRLRPTVEIGNVFNAVVLSFGSGFIDYSTFGVQRPSVTAATAPPIGSTILLTNGLETFENNFLVPTRAYRPRDIRLGFRFDF